MTKRVSLLQVGFGTVGGAVLEQVVTNRGAWRDTLGVDVTVGAVVGRSGAWLDGTANGFTDDALRAFAATRRAGQAPSTPAVAATEALSELTQRGPVIVMDASAGTNSVDLVVAALAADGGVVLSNKAPLALPNSDLRSADLWQQTGPLGRLRYEATCGAGLPVISTLRSLLDTGDEVLEISGTVSGTFGAIFSAVGQGAPFSEAVLQAKALGYTEPDPRDDLSGLDVARKGLILARTMGEHVDLEDIAVHSLVPAHLSDVSIEEFLARLSEADLEIGSQASEASVAGTSLKYLMDWKAGEGITVGLRQVPRSTVLGALQGPENIVSFRTRRYDQYPCVISGPGAGDAVTAAGMVADMLALAVRLAD